MMFILNFIKTLFVKQPEQLSTTEQTARAEGVVKYFNRKKGFGFIKSNQTEQDIFLHISNLEGRVWSGAKVAFHIEKNEKGLIAKSIEVIK